MWASPGAYVGDVHAQMWARLFSTVSESCVLCLWMAAWCNDACAMKHHVVHRCILQTRCMALRHCAERPARGFVRCVMDCVGSARQAFDAASVFNQNIGSWNTAAVTAMSGVRILVPSHACGVPWTSFSQHRSRQQVVPSADVGMAHFE